MIVLTPRQELENHIRNDARNVRDLQYVGNRELIARVIASCAKRLFQAQKIDKELVRKAEGNLRDAIALMWWE